MIVELTKNDNDLMNSFDFLFSTIFSYRINDDFINNSFTKYFIYLEKSNIIGFVNYYDLYERFEIANIYQELYPKIKLNKKINKSFEINQNNIGKEESLIKQIKKEQIKI